MPPLFPCARRTTCRSSCSTFADRAPCARSWPANRSALSWATSDDENCPSAALPQVQMQRGRWAVFNVLSLGRSMELKEVSAHMDKSVEAIRNEFATVRTGKASPALLDLIKV